MVITTLDLQVDHEMSLIYNLRKLVVKSKYVNPHGQLHRAAADAGGAAHGSRLAPEARGAGEAAAGASQGFQKCLTME